MRRSLNRQAGFTLLEALVALVVLGFLLAGLAQGVRFGVRAWDRQQAEVAVRADADAVDRVLRRLIERADPGRATVAAPIAGTRSSLRFVSDLVTTPGEPAHLSDIAVGVDAGHRLVLRWSPYLHAPRLVAAPAPAQSVLLAGLERIEFAYWGPDQAGARAWRDAWDGPDLPELIRIRLVFPAGDPRRWPPMVVAPMRAKAA